MKQLNKINTIHIIALFLISIISISYSSTIKNNNFLSRKTILQIKKKMQPQPLDDKKNEEDFHNSKGADLNNKFNTETPLCVAEEDKNEETNIKESPRIHDVKDVSSEFEAKVGNHEYTTIFMNSQDKITKIIQKTFDTDVNVLYAQYKKALEDGHCLKADSETAKFAKINDLFQRSHDVHEKIMKIRGNDKNDNNHIPIFHIVSYKLYEKTLSLAFTMELIKGNDLYDILIFGNEVDKNRAINQKIFEQTKINELTSMYEELTSKKTNNHGLYNYESIFKLILTAYLQLNSMYQIHSYDIKPSNVIIYKDKNSNLNVKLIDFDTAYIKYSEKENQMSDLHTTKYYYYLDHPSPLSVNMNSRYDEYQIGLVLLSVISQNNINYYDCQLEYNFNNLDQSLLLEETIIKSKSCLCIYLINSIFESIDKKYSLDEDASSKLKRKKHLNNMKEIIENLLNEDNQKRWKIKKANSYLKF